MTLTILQKPYFELVDAASRRYLTFGAAAAFALGAGAIAGLPAACAQTNTPGGATGTKVATPAVSGEVRTAPPTKNAEAAKAIDFTDAGTNSGKAIAGPSLKLPDGAATVRQLTAPIPGGPDTILLNVYKLNGDFFADVLTSHDNQAWTKRNHIRLKAPLMVRPDKMSVNMRYLEATHRHGFLLVASDESEDLALVFPNGFGGKVSQQAFMTQSNSGTRHMYTFGDQDSRGFAIVKESVDTTGQVKPADDLQFFVWNGREFIPRKAN